MAGDVSTTGQELGPADPVRLAVPDAPLALYRRYRPATFAEVKGQDHVTEPLRQALRSGRVHHAYLFSGPRGCGKTSSARILARSLNCEIGPTPDPCGKCASCVALAPAGPGSIDVIEIDAASHGGIDDARDLRERAFYSPVAARYKIYIIDEAHMVTGGGFNALLKLVEEPPPHLKFVFATTEPEKVIPTIRSRTHHYPFRLVPPTVLRELIEEILAAEKMAYEPAVLPVVIRAGTGSVRDSLSVLDQLMAGADDSGLRYDRAIALLGYTDDTLLDEMAEAFAATDGAAIFRTVDHVVEAGHDPRRFATDLLDRLRDLIILASVPDAAASGLLDVPEDRLERMRQQAAGFGQDRLVRAAETINAGLVEMRGATSPRLLLELMCAQVLVPAGPAAASDLAARIDRLERQVGTQGSRPAAAGSPTGSPAPSTGPAERRPTAAPSVPHSRPVRDDSEAGSAAPTAAPAGSAAGSSAAGSSAAGGSAAGGSVAGGSVTAPAPGRADDERPMPPDAAATRAGEAGRGTSSRQAADPAGEQAAASANQPASGQADASAVSNRWPDVLDAVRKVSRVAWILLANATLDSVEDGVLTLAFEREGDAKGFGSSGSSEYLADVLDQMFGTRHVIRTSVLSGAGGTAGGRPRRNASQAASGTGSRQDGADAARPHRAGADYASRDSAGPDSAGRDSAGRDSAGRDSAGRDSAGRDSAGRDSAGRDSAGRDSSGPDSGSAGYAGPSAGGQGDGRSTVHTGESRPSESSPGTSGAGAAGSPLAADGSGITGGARAAGGSAYDDTDDTAGGHGDASNSDDPGVADSARTGGGPHAADSYSPPGGTGATGGSRAASGTGGSGAGSGTGATGGSRTSSGAGATSGSRADSAGATSRSRAAGAPGSAGNPVGSGDSGGSGRTGSRAHKPGRADSRSAVGVAMSDDPRLDTDADPAGDNAGDALSGSDLIERALGGRVIGETGGA